ncbi:SusC/RagA family TonB-linked outer membrane protein [Chitinophagaceae bacterium LWZ2-11]
MRSTERSSSYRHSRILKQSGLALLLLIILPYFTYAAKAAPHQEFKFSMQVNGAKLGDVFSEIRKQTGLVIFYNNNILNDKEKVNINFANTAIEKVMDILLKGRSLSYKIADDYIIISKIADKKTVSKVIEKKTFAYTSPDNETPASVDTVPAIKLKGKVTGVEEGAPISRVAIENLVRHNGVFTNASGDFSIDVRVGDSLRFSYVGKASKVVVFNGQNNISVELTSEGSKSALNEVVVTGFQKIEKKKFTGAAVTLKADEIRQDGVVDVSRMLEGRAAGVAVQNVSSTFGSAPKIRIRGATSINGDNKPLWVVDGVVLEDIVNISNDQLSSGDPTTLLGSAVAGLNSNDIESFDILKDAAATALYGARAMNGVVVITTKKGRIGKPAVSFTANFSSQLKPNYNNFNIMNSSQQMSVLAELERKGLLNSDILDRADGGVYLKMYDLIDQYDSTNGQYGLINDQPHRNAFLKRYASANTDWFDILFKNSLMQEYSLSISSGTDKSQTYFSTSYYHDNGWTIADKVNRYTLNFRNNYKLNDKLSAAFATVGSVRQQSAPGSLSRTSNPVEGQYDRDFDINPFSYALNTSRTLTAYDQQGKLEYFRRNFAPFNIINELKNNYLSYNVIDLKLQGELSYKLTNNLRYEFVGALRYVKSTREDQIKENANMAEAYRAAGTSTIRNANKFLYRNPDNPEAQPVVVLPYGGFYNRTDDQLISYDVRNSLNFSKTIGANSITALVGQQIKSADRQNSSNTGYGYQYDNGGVPFVDYRILKQTIENNFPYYGMAKDYDRFAAFYANAQYTYNRKYVIDATGRYDGSNRLGQSQTARWLPTWTVSGKWNMEEEEFIHKISWIDYLAIKGSYGLTASMGPATNSSIVLQNTQTNRPYSDEVESVIQLSHLENSQLTWEKNYSSNIELYAGFFKNRLSITFDVYNRRSFDLISLIKTSAIGGEAYKTANVADMKSNGIDLMLSGDVIRQKNFNWNATLTYAYNKNQITNAKNSPIIFDLIKPEGGNLEGYPLHSLFSIQFKGLDHNTGIPYFINEQGQISPNVYLQDQSVKYLKYEGPVDPTSFGGFSNTFRYKALSLNVFLTYQAGNKIRLYPAFKTGYSDLDAMPKEFINRWELPGDEAKTNVPSILGLFEQTRTGGAYPYNNYNYSTERVASGDFIRMKTISLIYQFPQATLKTMGFNSLSITAAATNMFLLYSDKKLNGQDPEFFNAGGVAQPIQKQFTLSLKAGF